jgi:hypothetical protein
MEPNFTVNDAKEIFRFKNEETIRRYIRMGRALGNDIDAIKAITDPKQEGYLALCTVKNTLPYRITAESILLVLQRKLNISLSEAENILKSFEDSKASDKSSDEDKSSSDSENAVSPSIPADETDNAVRTGLFNGLFNEIFKFIDVISGAAGVGSALGATVGAVGSAVGAGLAVAGAAGATAGAVGNPKTVLYKDLYKKDEENVENADTDSNTDSDTDNNEYFNKVFGEIFAINEQLRLHDEEIADIRNRLKQITQKKEQFDEIYNREMELGKKMIQEREESKLAYHDELVKLHKGTEKRLKKER